MQNLPLTIKETQKGLLDKKFSAVELVDSYLANIEKGKDINAFITVTDDLAYTKAKDIDKLIQTGEKDILTQKPLLGVTVAHKDLFLTKDTRTTAGAKLLDSYIPQYSSTVVERYDNAGSILIGKTNCDAWAHGSSGENSDYGDTLNPWNKKYVPGGSSSGSGAALSANMALSTTGTDTCGSLRLPANYNYSVALKPTYGAVSRYGIIAMASSLDCPGPIGRSTEDVETVFNVIKGPDGLDSTVTQRNSDSARGVKKIGIVKEFFEKGLDDEVEKNINQAKKVFEKEGITFTEISLPMTKYAIDVYYIIQPAEVSSNLGRYDGIRYGKGRETFSDEAKRRIMLGTYVLSAGYYDAYYLQAQKVRSKVISEVSDTLDKVDALLVPVAPTPPFKLGEKVEDPLKMYLTDIYAATANLTGIPSLALPFGFSKDNLPLGFQLMGPRFSEDNLFKLGKLFEKATDYKPKVAI